VLTCRPEMLLTAFTAALLSTSALACADHNYHQQMKRAETNQTASVWAYEASYDWGRIDPSYVLCQDGTMQAPIPLRLDQVRWLARIVWLWLTSRVFLLATYSTSTGTTTTSLVSSATGATVPA
jgi:carbonic anhydrase